MNDNVGKKYKWLKSIWSDSVFAGVFSGGILLILPTVYATIKAFVNEESIKETIKTTFSTKIEIWKAILLFFLLLISVIILNRWIKKRGFANQKIGDFTFKELYQILRNKQIDPPRHFHLEGFKGKIDLLTAFLDRIELFNRGVMEEFHVYEFDKLGPNLMSYGLIIIVKERDVFGDKMIDIMRTAPDGYKFYQMLERLFTKNRKRKGNVQTDEPQLNSYERELIRLRNRVTGSSNTR